jgi:hypothetical protein
MAGYKETRFPCTPVEDTETLVVVKAGAAGPSTRVDPMDTSSPTSLIPRLAMDKMTSKVKVKRFIRFLFLNTFFMMLSSRAVLLNRVLAPSKYPLLRAAP